MGINFWDSAYESGHIPWDPGPYDGHLPRVVEEQGIAPCRVIDIGCGTGKSLVWLAEHGFDCTGIEMAPTALRMAEELAKSRGVRCVWRHASFPDDLDGESSGSYDFAIDRGVFHLHTGAQEQHRFVEGVARILAPGGTWYSLVASSAHGRNGSGPPRWSRREVERAVGKTFEIVRLEEAVFTPGEEDSMAAWLCVMRSRRTG